MARKVPAELAAAIVDAKAQIVTAKQALAEAKRKLFALEYARYHGIPVAQVDYHLALAAEMKAQREKRGSCAAA